MSKQTIPEPHPGEILLEEFIKPAGVTLYRVAKDSGISQPTMNQIVNGKRPSHRDRPATGHLLQYLLRAVAEPPEKL